MTMPTPKCPTCGAEMQEGIHAFVCTLNTEDHDAVLTVDAQAAYIATLEAEIAALKGNKNRIPDRYCPLCLADTAYYDGYHCTSCDYYQAEHDAEPLTAGACITALRQQLAEAHAAAEQVRGMWMEARRENEQNTEFMNLLEDENIVIDAHDLIFCCVRSAAKRSMGTSKATSAYG